MSRNPSTETFHLDPFHSPSTHRPPGASRSSSLNIHALRDPDIAAMDSSSVQNQPGNNRSQKRDRYSIPVFLIEILTLAGLGYATYYLHSLRRPKFTLSGFYCDDISLRHHLDWDNVQIVDPNGLLFSILMAASIVIFIIFCELVNSLFGALKFRRIKACCGCCKLHSITRRTVRFIGAYLLGLLIVYICVNVLALVIASPRPYFAQECGEAYRRCSTSSLGSSASTINTRSIGDASFNLTGAKPLSDPIIDTVDSKSEQLNSKPLLILSHSEERQMNKRSRPSSVFEREWIDFSDQPLIDVCRISETLNEDRLINLVLSCPSMAAGLASYSCFFLVMYLSYIGSARPFRMITCVLIMGVMLQGFGFSTLLVRWNYHHWQDIAISYLLSAVVMAIIFYVYLNRFRDCHFYRDQIMSRDQSRWSGVSVDRRSYASNEGFFNQYHMDKTTQEIGQPVIDSGNHVSSNNDLAMRYFQIPRANYRAGSRPVSSVNQPR